MSWPRLKMSRQANKLISWKYTSDTISRKIGAVIQIVAKKHDRKRKLAEYNKTAKNGEREFVFQIKVSVGRTMPLSSGFHLGLQWNFITRSRRVGPLFSIVCFQKFTVVHTRVEPNPSIDSYLIKAHNAQQNSVLHCYQCFKKTKQV